MFIDSGLEGPKAVLVKPISIGEANQLAIRMDQVRKLVWGDSVRYEIRGFSQGAFRRENQRKLVIDCMWGWVRMK